MRIAHRMHKYSFITILLRQMSSRKTKDNAYHNVQAQKGNVLELQNWFENLKKHRMWKTLVLLEFSASYLLGVALYWAWKCVKLFIVKQKKVIQFC